jgi:hypothetical protein
MRDDLRHSLRKLAVINVRIYSALREQFCMRACFHNIAMIHHNNAVSIVNGGKAVRHDKARAPI